jgi:large subunit ribosomal protein L22
MIRGKDVNKALAILRYANKRAAEPITKCMKSAIANANEAAEKANISIDADDLWVKSAYVDRGPTKNRRRVRPAPQGRAYRERRHFCHVTILLSSEPAEPKEGKAARGDRRAATAKSAKLAESKGRKRGGAVAAPRAKRTAPKTEAEPKADHEKKTRRTSEKKASAEEASE